MKLILTLAAVLVLSACASNPAKTAEVIPAPAPTIVYQPISQPYALPQAPARTVTPAPTWFVNLPEDTTDMMFAAGTATSTDEQMAYDKARMSAERKLVENMYSRVQTQTKSYRADRGDAMIENFQQVTRKNARGELSGAQRVDSRATFDGRIYKVYVLVRLPLGTNNVIQNRRDQARAQREADISSRAAEQDMDRNESAERGIQRENDDDLTRRLAPQSKVVPVTKSVDTGTIQLLDVDNAEYKRRRDEALSKPNAVIGQTVLR